MASIHTVLIANRGEIAVRIARSMKALGVKTVAPFTEPDRRAYHRREVDASFEVESYLDAEALIEGALAHGAQAVHPGYGFLSESAAFAQSCLDSGLVFIGPSPEAIAAMGDKLVAKETMARAGLPTVPSWSGPLAEVVAGAHSVGYPLLVKAAAGGGGKGMRRVNGPEELTEAVERAQSEARNAFGDDRIFLERFLENPRHIEVQIFGDRHGRALCFGERECSLQRRYQKIVEEAPSPAVEPGLRARLMEAGERAVSALGYTGAGTVEFILDQQGNFYFLEVNTRLQVEHPVTELVYGLDLVALGLQVAEGAHLDLPSEHLQPRGWAIEARIYAEDPDRNFLPSVGELAVFRPPLHPDLRLDSGYREGDTVGSHFDPMLAKLIAYGTDRERARRTLVYGLRNFSVLGVNTNIPYLVRVLESEPFRTGQVHTQLLERERESFAPPETLPHESLAAALAGAFCPAEGAPLEARRQLEAKVPSPWELERGWRGNP